MRIIDNHHAHLRQQSAAFRSATRPRILPVEVFCPKNPALPCTFCLSVVRRAGRKRVPNLSHELCLITNTLRVPPPRISSTRGRLGSERTRKLRFWLRKTCLALWRTSSRTPAARRWCSLPARNKCVRVRNLVVAKSV